MILFTSWINLWNCMRCFRCRYCLISHPVTSSMKRVYRVSTLPTYIITISASTYSLSLVSFNLRRSVRLSPTKASGNSLSTIDHLSASKNQSNDTVKQYFPFLRKFFGKKLKIEKESYRESSEYSNLNFLYDCWFLQWNAIHQWNLQHMLTIKHNKSCLINPYQSALLFY